MTGVSMQVGANFGNIQANTSYVRRGDAKNGERFGNELGTQSQNQGGANDENLKARNLEQNTQNAQKDSMRLDSVNTPAHATQESATEKLEALEGHPNRVTYGLKVIELMSDQEYQAFLWASEGMSEAEKIMMAQSLYRFTSFYQGKPQEMPSDMQTRNAQKAFGVDPSIMDDFMQRYKNAYEKILYDSALNSHLA